MVFKEGARPSLLPCRATRIASHHIARHSISITRSHHVEVGNQPPEEMVFKEGARPSLLTCRATRIASHHIARHMSMRSSTRRFQRTTAQGHSMSTSRACQLGTSSCRVRRPNTCAFKPAHIMHFARTTLPLPMPAARRIELALAAS